jgi:hypothetical protein
VLDKAALQAVVGRFDPAQRGGLDWVSFLDLTLFLRSATATFNAFDAQRSGTIQLNFNQFLYASAMAM